MTETQELITDLQIRDNLTVALAKAKAELTGFGASTTAASAQLTAMEASAAKATATFSGLGSSVVNSIKAFVGIGVGLKAVQFLGDAVKAAQEDEVSVARLTAALKANVPAWDGQTAAIEKAIEAGAKLGFSDDEIRSSLGRLVAATHDLGKANEIMAVAQDLARFKGVDLATATDALVHIEAGRYRGLADLGIVLEKGTTQTEALAAVQRVAAGSAKAFGNTSAGAAVEAGIAFDEAKEAIGRGLLPVIIVLSNLVKDDLAPALTVVGENMDKILPVAEALALVFGAKLAIGIVASGVALTRSTAALIANAIQAAGATTATTALAEAEGTEAIAANAAAVAEERLAIARTAGAGAAGAGLAGAAGAAGAGAAGVGIGAAAGQTAMFTETAASGAAQLEVFTGAELAAAEGATAVGVAGAAAAKGGLAQFVAGLRNIAVLGGTIGVGIEAGRENVHQFAIETADAGFKTRSYAEAADRLQQSVAFGSLTQAEADAILVKYSGTVAEATTGIGLMTQSTDESARAARVAAGEQQALIDQMGAATDASLRYALALTGSTTGTEADAAAKSYLALVDKDLADKTDAIVDAFGRLFIPAKQAPKIFGDVADAATGAGDELLIIKDDANQAAFALAGIPKDTRINITYVTSDIHRNIVENTADTSDDAMRFAVAQHNIQFDIDQAAREQAIKDERDRKNKEALAQAKADAAAYAQTLEGQLNKALSNAKDLSESLFAKQHERVLRAIADAEKLAETQHDAATQAISDALKLQLQRDAAPVTEAEKAQSDIEISRQNRDLHASLAAAQQTGDPEQIRRAQESLQSFQAAQHISYLKEQQAIHDLAAQKEATDKQKAADDKLNAAKLAQAAAIETENARNKKQVDDFERQLAALKERDKGASPGKVKQDITDLETKFGITTDSSGRHHIEDPLVTAIKTIKIAPPNIQFHATVYSPAIFLNGRQIAAAMASNQSPAATPGVRTGILRPARG